MIVREFSLGSVLSIADCCLGLILIKFSSVAVAIIAAMPTTFTAICIAKPVRDVEQHHVAGERQQNAEAIDWQRVLATADRAAHHRRHQPSPIARHEPCCQNRYGQKMQQSQWIEIRFIQLVQLRQRLRDQCFQRFDAPAQCDDQAEEQIQDGKSKHRA